MRPHVVRFLEARTLVRLAEARAGTAKAAFRMADEDALTDGERAIIGEACQALEAAETVEGGRRG